MAVKDMIKGQLVEIIHNEKEEDSNWWEYGVILEVFDDRVMILTNSNLTIMQHSNNDEETKIDDKWFNKDFEVTELYRDGRIVMAKKNIFGKYKLNNK